MRPSLRKTTQLWITDKCSYSHLNLVQPKAAHGLPPSNRIIADLLSPLQRPVSTAHFVSYEVFVTLLPHHRKLEQHSAFFGGAILYWGNEQAPRVAVPKSSPRQATP